MKRLFIEGFSVLDVAEPLLSFESERDAGVVHAFMVDHRLKIIGVRKHGTVVGYALLEDLTGGLCGDHLHRFEEDQILTEDAHLPEAIQRLASSEFCFVSVVGVVSAVVLRRAVQTPPVRMWLFGMITITEMYVTKLIEVAYPDDSWQKEISPQRLARAKSLWKERKRRNQDTPLLECLQLSDKGAIVVKDPEIRQEFDFRSRKEAERRVKEFESLRNNLAHSQDVERFNWDAIVSMAQRIDRIVTRI